MDIAAAESFYKEYFQYLPEGFDDVYIIHANSGEAYSFLAYLAKALMKKNGAKNPLFVGTKPYHTDIIKLYFPKARYVYYDMYLKESRLGVLGDFWEYGGHKFFQMFSPRHFNSVNASLGALHYFDAMLQTLDIKKEDAAKPAPTLPAKIKNDSKKIAQKINLDLENFVIIAPEALTTNLMPEAFWRDLIKNLINKGYDIFLNVTDNKLNLNCKTSRMTFAELYALAGMSKGVISLRSGVSEFLIPSKAKNIVLCPRFHWSASLSAKQCIDAYSVMKLPYTEKYPVYELNPETYPTEKHLIDNIIDIIES